jgi:hypothetical protein
VTCERDRLPKSSGRTLVDPLAVTNEHVVGLDGEQPPRRRQPEQRRDAKPLSRRAVVLGGADRVGADERPLLRVPEGDLVPPAAPQERQDLKRRLCRGLLGNLVVWNAKLLGDGTAVTAVPVEQLHNAGRVSELTRARQRALVGYRIDYPDAPLRRYGVGGPLHEAWLGCDPAESEADLIDKANAVHATGTGRELLTCRQSAVRRRPYATVSSSSSDRGFQIGAVGKADRRADRQA